MNSKLPSSLDQGVAALATVLARQKKQRLQVGSGNIIIGAPAAGKLHNLQKQHSLPNSSSEELPPLKGNMEPAPGAANFATAVPWFSRFMTLSLMGLKRLSLMGLKRL